MVDRKGFLGRILAVIAVPGATRLDEREAEVRALEAEADNALRAAVSEKPRTGLSRWHFWCDVSLRDEEGELARFQDIAMRPYMEQDALYLNLRQKDFTVKADRETGPVWIEIETHLPFFGITKMRKDFPREILMDRGDVLDFCVLPD